MGAREKLNGAALAGAIVVAGFIGLVSQSWSVFLLALGLALAIAVASGDIRLRPAIQRGFGAAAARVRRFRGRRG